MDAEKLNALIERADRAKQIAADIAALKKASRFTPNVLKLKSHGGLDAQDLLPHLLLCQLFDLGKAQLLAKLQMELSDLLEPSKVSYDAIGTLDSSDTWEQPLAAVQAMN